MPSERGYVGMRALAALGLVSLLVWIVPMVLLSKKQAELATSVAPASAPEGGGGEVAAGVATDPIGTANDLQAQATMNNAIRVAQIWYAENGSYAGFGPAQASEYDPSIAFTSGPPAAGSVTMRVTPETVVMVTLAPGGPLCAAATLDAVSTGRTDATSPQQCEGGWA